MCPQSMGSHNENRHSAYVVLCSVTAYPVLYKVIHLEGLSTSILAIHHRFLCTFSELLLYDAGLSMDPVYCKIHSIVIICIKIESKRTFGKVTESYHDRSLFSEDNHPLDPSFGGLSKIYFRIQEIGILTTLLEKLLYLPYSTSKCQFWV